MELNRVLKAELPLKSQIFANRQIFLKKQEFCKRMFKHGRRKKTNLSAKINETRSLDMHCKFLFK